MDKLRCPNCEGEGYFAGIGADRYGDPDEIACTMCRGEGKVDHPGPCAECDGAKILTCDHDPNDKFNCPTCDGRGWEMP